MLGDADLQGLDNQLGALLRDNQQHHENVQNLLKQFQALIESYNLLKSDFEEEKEAREKYKKLARGQERNPFVLVLVDGDGYLFKEHLMRAGTDGGVTAARLLSDSVKELLHSKLGNDADQCRVMVRIYANILGLSKALARAGIVGNEARSLSPFASSFTRSQDLFDFVDAGDKKEGADFKIRELFRLFADNNQCKHIFFAGCHDAGYLSMLTPYRGRSDRVTLIKAASFHYEYESLDLPVREIPSVFMSVPMGDSRPTVVPTKSTPNLSSPTTICKHFLKGTCKFGNECTKSHGVPSQHNSRAIDDALVKSLLSPTAPHAPATWTKELQSQSLPSIVTLQMKELIPVNKDGERIDTYCPSPPQEAWDLYQRRLKQHKLCNKYHLGGSCPDPTCQFDHSPVERPALDVMKYILRQHPCSQGSRCRSLKCYTGHHCQKEGCKGKSCRFNRHAHTLDITVAEWVSPIEGNGDVDEHSITSESTF